MQSVRGALGVLILVLAATSALATDVSGSQAGTWTLADSPFNVVGDITIPNGDVLVIEPGVEVSMQGHYRITVSADATLLAAGTSTSPILFTAANPATGWFGLRILEASDDTVIRHCIIEHARKTSGSWQDMRGGGIYVDHCSPTIVGNELRDNYTRNANANGAGGGICVAYCSGLIADNYIHDNVSDSGGGICIMEYGTPIVRDNVVTNNNAYYAGGGMYFGARSTPVVDRNVIMYNWSAGWGGGGINSWTSYYFYSTFATVRNNVVAKNTTSTDGGGLYCRYDKCVLQNNVIADNTAASRGGGVYAINAQFDQPEVTSSILWGNTAAQGAQIYLDPNPGYGPSLITVAYSDVEGGWEGTGNINEPPKFIDAVNGDYHLEPASDCIDTGDPGFVPAVGETDFDGEHRVWDGDGDGTARVDMGVDEVGSHRTGDLNCDGAIDFDDINAFVAALNGEQAYYALYPDCLWELADCNGDGAIGFDDINAFVALIGS